MRGLVITRHVLLAGISALSAAAELNAWPGATTRRIAPHYPPILRQTGFRGTVDIQYEIDTSGHVVPGSVRVLKTSQNQFTGAVRYALPETRFAPPRRNGTPVRVKVEESIRFEPSGNGLGRLFARSGIAHTVDSAGVLHTTVASYIARDTTVPRLSDEDTWAIYAAVAEHFVRMARQTPSAYCVVAGGMRPSDRLFARWRTSGRKVMPLTECPRTYASMIYSPDRRAPPGWVDPVRIELLAPQPWRRDVVILEARQSQGTGTQYFTCEVVRDADGWGTVTCVTTHARVS